MVRRANDFDPSLEHEPGSSWAWTLRRNWQIKFSRKQSITINTITHHVTQIPTVILTKRKNNNKMPKITFPASHSFTFTHHHFSKTKPHFQNKTPQQNNVSNPTSSLPLLHNSTLLLHRHHNLLPDTSHRHRTPPHLHLRKLFPNEIPKQRHNIILPKQSQLLLLLRRILLFSNRLQLLHSNRFTIRQRQHLRSVPMQK